MTTQQLFEGATQQLQAEVILMETPELFKETARHTATVKALRKMGESSEMIETYREICFEELCRRADWK